jgi:integrase
MPKRRSRGTGGLYKRADGLWCGSVDVPTTDGRRRRRVVCAKDRGAAAQKLAAVKKEIEAGQFATSAKTTVEAWLGHWLENIHKPQVKPTTYRYYADTIRLYIVPRIGKIRLSKLSQNDVRQLHAAIQQDSTRAAQKAHQVLQKALKDAMHEGLLSRNVAEAVKKPKHVKDSPKALTAEAARALIRSAIDAGDPLAARWATAFLTAGRQGEVIGLELDRLHHDLSFMDLSWQLQQLPKIHGCPPSEPCGKQRAAACPAAKWDMPPGFEFRPCYRSLVWTRPKSSAGTRIVPVIEPLQILLRDHLERTAHLPNPHGLVWRHPDGRPIAPRDDSTLWHQALDKAELPAIGLHAARHTTATLLLAAGVPEQVRMQIMGQSSVDAHRGYVHVDQSQTRAALENLTLLTDLD